MVQEPNQHYAAKLIAKRRAERSEDLVSAMLEAEIDGEKISDFDFEVACAAE